MKSIRVVAAIIEHEHKILATQRGYGTFKGSWEFPGGKIEPGEDSRCALRREIKEELNAQIEIVRYITQVQYDYDDFHLDMDCYLCKLQNEHFDLLEHLQACWVDASHLNSLDWLPADIALLEELKEQGIV